MRWNFSKMSNGTKLEKPAGGSFAGIRLGATDWIRRAFFNPRVPQIMLIRVRTRPVLSIDFIGSLLDLALRSMGSGGAELIGGEIPDGQAILTRLSLVPMSS